MHRANKDAPKEDTDSAKPVKEEKKEEVKVSDDVIVMSSLIAITGEG